MSILRLTIFACLLLLGGTAYTQIPASGADVSSLSGLRWDMTLQDAKSQLKREITTMSDTMATFSDTLLNSKVNIALNFSTPQKKDALQSISIQVEDLSRADALLSYLQERHGDKFGRQNKEEKKFFVTIHLEMTSWLLKEEVVAAIRVWRGTELVGVSLLYKKRVENEMKSQDH